MILIFLVAVTGFEYLVVDPVAQRACMGYALSGDGHSIQYNPAGLAIASGRYFSISYLNYIGGSQTGFLGYENNTIGFGIKYFNSGKIKKTDALGREFGYFSTNFIDANFGKGFFYNDIAFGGSLKLVYEQIDTLFAAGIGCDVGAMYFLSDENVQIGLAVKNLGTTIKPFINEKETLPYEINLGICKRLPGGWFGLDLVKPSLVNFGARLGGEFAVHEFFAVKLSYSTLLSQLRTNTGLDFLAGLTVGFSIRKDPLMINYTYSPYFELGRGHRISIRVGG